jgi:predicted glycogen debranching enzyme
MIEFGREICGNPDLAASREWLVTNAIGGYASGSVSGEMTRRYQGLLVAALNPPVVRTLLVTKLDETVVYDGTTFELTTDRWESGIVRPHGYRHIERFRLDGSVPVWTFACADALIEKRVWMERYSNTVYVRYRVLRASRPVELTVQPVVNYRGSHDIMNGTDWEMDISREDDGLILKAGKDLNPIRLAIAGADVSVEQSWRTGYYLWVDDDRGIHPQDNHLQAGRFQLVLREGQETTFIASAEQELPDLRGALERRVELDSNLIARSSLSCEPKAVRQLVLAADQFIVRRSFDEEEDGRSVIAGYHWFEDWGRDTMIALPGLALATGRPEVARKIILTYASKVDQGMLPNRFPEDGGEAVYNTIDATPWFFEATRGYHAATGDDELLRLVFPVLEEVVDWHERGTRYGIRFDPDDGLVCSGPEGAPLTWMDAKMGEFVPTPRVGKPVEVNALWYNALCSMAGFAKVIGTHPERYTRMAERLRTGFERFWNENLRYCFDVIDSPDGDDPALRPNQLFAVSLEHSPLDSERQAAIVDVCGRKLLTSHGLRSLAPDDDDYIGTYSGDLRKRDAAYHQGTVWSWLIGPFVSAHYRVHQNRDLARSFLDPLFLHLTDHGIGSISEVFDADPPFLGRGCIAQAWGVSEILRVWKQTMR